MKPGVAAPRGRVPKRGEVWEPVGRKAAIAAFFLVPVERVRHLVPEELPIVQVAPGRTIASLFVGDYGPGSTLEFHELGVQPALVRCHTGPALWSSLVLVDSEASYVGGEPLGFYKEMAEFDWQEEASGRRGHCTVSQEGRQVLRLSHRRGRIPLPSLPMRVTTLREDILFSSQHHLRGRHRLSKVRLEVPDASPLSHLRQWGDPIAGIVISGLHGRMGDRVLATFLPHRASSRPEASSAPKQTHPKSSAGLA